MQAKIKYVNARHTASIRQLEKGVQKGRWKTYWGHGKNREPITRSSKEKIYEELYKRYKAQESRDKTLSEVFEILEQYKKDCLGRSEKTLSEDRRLFNHLPEDIRSSPISGISEEDIQKALISIFSSEHPTTSAMKKTVQVLDQIFRRGIKKEFCKDNPMTSIDVGEYGKYSNPSQKAPEEKQFSKEELSIIESDCWSNWHKRRNPRALMSLMAKETGMRAGELPAFHKEDIVGDYLHVHRQQIHDGSQKPEVFYEVGYTKDEKKHPHDGRFIPITKEISRIIDEAMKIPGDSVYLFHEKNKADAITKGSYCQNLRNRTKRLGTQAHNNHAFRMSLNARLIDLGFSPSERALILGHEVQTNENNYSLKDKRRLEDIKTRLVNAKEK